MNPIDRTKLSGLLDGELSPQEVAEVQRALRDDPDLCREYEELAALDAEWKAVAQSAAFRPSVTIPRRAAPLPLRILALTALLLLLRCVTKVIPPIDAGILGAFVLTAVVACLATRLRKGSDEDLRGIAQGPSLPQ